MCLFFIGDVTSRTVECDEPIFLGFTLKSDSWLDTYEDPDSDFSFAARVLSFNLECHEDEDELVYKA